MACDGASLRFGLGFKPCDSMKGPARPSSSSDGPPAGAWALAQESVPRGGAVVEAAALEQATPPALSPGGTSAWPSAGYLRRRQTRAVPATYPPLPLGVPRSAP